MASGQWCFGKKIVRFRPRVANHTVAITTLGLEVAAPLEVPLSGPNQRLASRQQLHVPTGVARPMVHKVPLHHSREKSLSSSSTGAFPRFDAKAAESRQRRC